MKKTGNLFKHLSLIGCIAAICVLLAPAVTAEVFIPVPYSLGPGQESVIGGTSVPGPLMTPLTVIPSSFPGSTGNGIISYPIGISYPVNPTISLPSIAGQGAGSQVIGAYYAGSGTRPAGFGSTGARYMCSF